MEAEPIENHGIIGDLHTAALVATDGSIDFLCFPSFDSPTLFAALLDPERGGRFQIGPVRAEVFKRKQLYFPDTNMLLTRFLSSDGVAEVSDFMPIKHLGHSHDLVRRVKVVRGEIALRMLCAPRFDYGRAAHTAEAQRDQVLFVSKGRHRSAVRLRTCVPVKIRNGDAVAEFKLRAGQSAAFILEEVVAGEESPSARADYSSESFKETMNFWLDWVSRSKYRGRWREMVNRSALTLKLLTSRPCGSIAAAPTFGLPEEIGGSRNWDYRFAWIRDASFTLYALMRLGYMEEAAAFMRWIEDRSRGHTPSGPLQVVYALDGNGHLPEKELRHFAGFRGSRPVRIGNGAARQLQLDIYGELLDSVYLYDKYGKPISYDFWTHLVRQVDWVCAHWRRPDDSIWEVRGGPRPFLYSRVLCWVAIDRGIRIAEHRSFPAPLVKWRRVRDQIYQQVYNQFWNPKLCAFMQYKGGKTVDASSLLMPLVKFISANDPRWRSHMETVKHSLVEDSLVYRYNVLAGGQDGLPGREGTFTMCSFWYVECLARAGDLKQARFLFEKMLGYANHLGLYSEELGLCGEHLGNFPQAFTHLALISAAWNLDSRLSKAHED
ncbi:MAG TPA: glycoside hydrolase family 15 protein [Candidatus Acidoferrum sp.]|nr:glycoside hydrolase family 15 protein [Candidatus Acidoferrum sp.]